MLREFLEKFMAFVPLQLPQLLDSTKMHKPLFYDDYVLLTFDTSNGYDLEEVMDMMEDDIELIMLYHHLPSRHTMYKHSTCAYSNPNFGQMFKMNAETDDSGKVKHISVTIYESLEYMCADICLDLKLHEKGGFFKYKRNRETVLLDFM